MLEADSVEAGRELLAGEAIPSFGIFDLKLPDGSGLDLVSGLSARNPQARSVVLTGWGSIPTALEAVRRGAIDFLAKPIEIGDLLRALGEAPAVEATPGEPEVPSLDRVEWEHIQRVLASCDGNVSQAARLLGLHRRSLQRKLGKRPPRR